MNDKRKEERINKNIKSEVSADEHMTFSSSVDWSKGGVFISTPEPLGNGSEVTMTIRIGDGEELDVKGVVKWTRSEESESGRVGMGIEFTELDPEKAEMIGKIIK